jgi:hypothetical protein
MNFAAFKRTVFATCLLFFSISFAGQINSAELMDKKMDEITAILKKGNPNQYNAWAIHEVQRYHDIAQTDKTYSNCKTTPSKVVCSVLLTVKREIPDSTNAIKELSDSMAKDIEQGSNAYIYDLELKPIVLFESNRKAKVEKVILLQKNTRMFRVILDKSTLEVQNVLDMY